MKKILLGATLLLLCGCASNASLEPAMSVEDSVLVNVKEKRTFEDRPKLSLGSPDDFTIFSPSPRKSGVQIDYGAWNDILRSTVFNMGPSTRQRAPSVKPATGTRFVNGHDSPFRLEGNRIFFSLLTDEQKLAINEYKQDLIELANRFDIAALSKNEQLAYWINLHNVVVIDAIAQNYPVRDPAKMKFGDNGDRLDAAKLIMIRGVPLSLQDIRMRIVYPNWSSPQVIYGFFRGDIGGPRIHTGAFTASTVATKLNSNAREFVNSLRGVTVRHGRLYVSRVYEEARPFYFEDWPDDLRAHMREHIRDEFRDDIDLSGEILFGNYDGTVADMAGGEPIGSIASTQVVTTDQGGAFFYSPVGLPRSFQRMYQETQEKLALLQKRGWARGRVVIEDVPTEDPEVD